LLAANWFDGVPLAESGSLPQDFVVAGHTAFFTADDGTHGRELWKTDGSPGGTSLVKDIRPGSDGIGTPTFTAVGDGSVMFVISEPGSGDSQLWVSDGSDAGTKSVMDVSSGAIVALGYANGVRYFTVSTNESNVTPGLWRTDGTAGGTNLLRPMKAADHFVELNGVTYFLGADDAGNSAGLWKTNGTNPGTSFVAPVSDLDSEPVVLNNSIYFLTSTSGQQLWRSDGTNAGTQMVQQLPLKDANQPVVVGNNLFFGALEEDNTFSLWRSNGAADGSNKVAALPASAPNIIAAGSQLYFALNITGTGAELWHSDGTAGGTAKLKTLAPADHFISTRDLEAAGNLIYFSVPFGAGGVELWRSDGSVANTRKVATLNPTAGDVSNAPPLLLGNSLLFDAFTPSTGWELHSTEGIVANINTQHAEFAPSELVRYFRKTYVFTADDGFHGRELWLTDRTAAGTHLLADVRPGERESGARDLTVVGKTIYFVANDGVHGDELWRSDGTEAGTTIVADRSPGLASSNITGVFNVNGTAHFADSGSLYRIDPASGQIKSVSSIAQTGAPVQPSGNGNLYFLSDLQTVSRTRGDGEVRTSFAATQAMDEASLDVVATNVVYTGHIHRVAPAPPNQKIVQIVAPAPPGVGSPAESSPTSTLRNNVVRVFGTPGDDVINLVLDESDPTMLDATVNGQTLSYPVSDIRVIIVYGGMGDDSIRFDATHGAVKIASKLYGDAGSDTIFGGATRDRIYGGEGDDSLDGGSGNDILYGEADNDVLVGSAGNDYIVGGEGADSIQGNKGRDRIFTEPSIDVLTKDKFDLVAIDSIPV
jgi:ELWxxDGT repeat protein